MSRPGFTARAVASALSGGCATAPYVEPKVCVWVRETGTGEIVHGHEGYVTGSPVLGGARDGLWGP